jgi:hypothetical protein
MGSIWNVGVGRWHLAAAEDISLGLSLCGCQGLMCAAEAGSPTSTGVGEIFTTQRTLVLYYKKPF